MSQDDKEKYEIYLVACAVTAEFPYDPGYTFYEHKFLVGTSKEEVFERADTIFKKKWKKISVKSRGERPFPIYSTHIVLGDVEVVEIPGFKINISPLEKRIKEK